MQEWTRNITSSMKFDLATHPCTTPTSTTLQTHCMKGTLLNASTQSVGNECELHHVGGT